MLGSRNMGGWYADADNGETYTGHVWQLPAHDGTPRYVAGYTEGDTRRHVSRDSGYVMLELTSNGRALELYETKEEAARAGDSLAEHYAEEAREYSERWQEASDADSDRDEAREALKRARVDGRAAVAALRELRTCEPDSVAHARHVARDALDAARDEMREAIAKIETARERIAQLDMEGEF